MIDQELIRRINQLAKKKKTVGLTEEEQAEQARLYKVYLEAIRGQVRQQLDRIQFVDSQKH